MSQDRWTAVDRYFTETLVRPDPVFDAVLRANADAGLPPYDVSPSQGKLLELLARIQGARSILEIGTLGGYSTIWLARALPPGGRLVTLEVDPGYARVARANFARAGVADAIELRVGNALETLPRLAAEGYGPFDLVFIDADKQNNPQYFTSALELSRKGTLVVVDNVVRAGAVADPASTDPIVQGVRRLNDMLAADPRVSAVALQTVGSKGWDGMAIVLVTGQGRA